MNVNDAKVRDEHVTECNTRTSKMNHGFHVKRQIKHEIRLNAVEIRALRRMWCSDDYG